MVDALLMDRMFQRIMRGLVDTGSAPRYAELARALGLGVEKGRLLLHDVKRAYPIGWLHPETDYIASFPSRADRQDQPVLARDTGPRRRVIAQAG